MIDLHCHVLPGVDDGPATIQAAIDLARVARADGIATIAATPHVDGGHPELDSHRIGLAVRGLQARLDAAGVDVRIVTGAEVAFTRAMLMDDAELHALTLGGGGWLLLECPLNYTATPGFLGAARMLARRGHRLLLAHPERCPIFLRSSHALAELVGEGMLAQVTAGALAGAHGQTVRGLARGLVERGLVHVVASDGHDANRPAKIAGPLARTALPSTLIDWLARDVPAALLAGGEPPPRPPVVESRSGPRSGPRGRLARLVGR